MYTRIRQALVDFVKREDGPTAVEYAVMLSLIIVACIFSVSSLGSNTNKTFTKISTALSSAS